MPEFRYLTRGSACRDFIMGAYRKGTPSREALGKTAEVMFRAWDLLCQENLEDALSLAHESLILDGCCREALVLTAEVAIQSGHMEKAEHYLVQALKARPEAQPPDQSAPDDMIRYIYQALSLMHVFESMGALCVLQGDYDQALKILETVPDSMIPFIPWARFQMARLYTLAGKPDEALACFPPEMGLCPPGTDYDAALCHIMKRDVRRAIQSLQEGFFESPYIALAIMGEPVPEEMRANNHEQYRQSALAYVRQMRDAWEKTPNAVDFMRAVWDHPAVRRETVEYCRLANRPLVSSKGVVAPDMLKSLGKLVSSRHLKKASYKIAKDIPPILSGPAPDTNGNED
ncbi:MAG: hypothetical protein DRP79_06425 [Planctomycetota bacterium]|nr:MAG: hypothetical protein DRP79_06425 [Planctomycetota bacterium]